MTARDFDHWYDDEDPDGLAVRVQQAGDTVSVHVSPKHGNSYTYTVRVIDGELRVLHAPEPVREG